MCPHSCAHTQVTAAFRRSFPDTFDRAIPVLNHKEVDLLLLELDMAMWEYEKVDDERGRNLLLFCCYGSTCTNQLINQATSIQGRSLWKMSGERPTSKTGCCGLWGEKYDVLDKLRDKMLDLQDRIREARDKAINHGSTPAW
jgi:hypothetical protein